MKSAITLDKMQLFVALFDSEIEKQILSLKRRPRHEEVLRKELGMRLRNLRKRAGLKRKEAAELLGKAESMISYYEGGDRFPPVEYIDLLAEKLNLKREEVDELKSILYFLRLTSPRGGRPRDKEKSTGSILTSEKKKK